MAELVVRTGRYFEDHSVGDSIKTAARTVTESDVVAFAALSGDWNAIHCDAEYAAHGMFGERIAHGLLGLSIASGLAVRLGFMEETVIAFLGLDWKFRAAIKIGDTIHVRGTITELKPMPRLGGGNVVLNVEIVNQRGEITQRGSWTLLVKSRPSS